jgi:hypothetical protein
VNQDAFDTVARQAADGLSRRGSLVALSGAALAATFAGASVTKAGKAGKKARKKCKKQGSPCREFADELCETLLPPGGEQDACKEDAKACCPSLEKCKGAAFFDCAFQVVLEALT